MNNHPYLDKHLRSSDHARLDVAVNVLDDAVYALRVLAAGCDDHDVTEYLSEAADDVQQCVTEQIKSARDCLEGEPHCRQIGYTGTMPVFTPEELAYVARKARESK